MNINDLLQTAVDAGASDLHLKVGSYPVMRVNGELAVASEEKRLEPADTEAMAGAIMGPEQAEKFGRFQEVDLAYSVPGSGGSAQTCSSSAAASASCCASSRSGSGRSTSSACRAS